MTRNQNKPGFTIIEVVLVLAIAGLIFLMVFIALPALQRGQRDDARKRDVSLIATAVTNFSSANRGRMPSNTELQGYLDDLSGNVTKDKVTVNTSKPSSVAPESGAAVVVTARKCGSSTNTSQALTAGSARQFVVVTKLEQGNGQYLCQDS